MFEGRDLLNDEANKGLQNILEKIKLVRPMVVKTTNYLLKPHRPGNSAINFCE